MSPSRVVAVTAEACTPETARRLVAEGCVVIVWSPEGHLGGRLAAMVTGLGGRAATFTAPATARAQLGAFAAEQFGGLDEVLEDARQAPGD